MNPTMQAAVRATLLALVCAGPAAAADPFPTRPVRIVVPSSTGGAMDITTRLVARKMEEVLGQPVVVENRPGAGSLLGTRLVKDAKPDGYTLLAQTDTFSALPAMKLDPGYDPLKHFTAVGPLMRAAQIMYVSSTEPDRTVAQFVSRARANPGKLSYAHGGPGTPTHLGSAQFVHQLGLDVLSIPYKGTGAAMPDVVAGRVTLMFAGYAGGASYLQAGRLRPLGVSGSRRMAVLPDVPTLKEQGIDFTYYFWVGLLAPAGTPDDVIDRLADALKHATANKELADRFAEEGSEPARMTPREFNAYLAKEVSDYATLARELKMERD